jgi:Methylamine utilisation protein MauE
VLDPAFGYLIILGIALLFASAGALKLQDLARFTEIFAAYRVVPSALARRLAWLIPCLELSVAITLLWEPSRRMAVISGIAVLIAYASGLGVNLRRGRRDLDCGCGAARDRRAIAAWMVWRNLILAAAVGIAALPWSPRPFSLTDCLTVMGGLLVGATLYAAVDRLLGDVAPKAMILRSTS